MFFLHCNGALPELQGHLPVGGSLSAWQLMEHQQTGSPSDLHRNAFHDLLFSRGFRR